MSSRSRCAVALLWVTAACGTGSPLASDARQGIDGMVLIGPQCPVQSIDDPCPDLPHEASIDVRVRGGALITRVRSDVDGTFRVGLSPGSYTLEPEQGDPFPTAAAQEVEVFARPAQADRSSQSSRDPTWARRHPAMHPRSSPRASSRLASPPAMSL